MSKSAIYILTIVACIIIPILGVFLDDQSVQKYLEFPPMTKYVQHLGFSKAIFFIIALVDLALIVSLIRALWRGKSSHCLLYSKACPPFPWWGWFGLLFCGISWLLAWNRFDWFASFQHHTFIMLWVSYVIVVNAIVFKRSGSCPALQYPVGYVLLFPVSAVFWWLFEYFNRFVQNWYYIGIEGFTKGEYIVFATISFSTVLPAVFVTRSLLLTFETIDNLKNGRSFQLRYEKSIAVFFLVLSIASLFLIGVFPSLLFPFLWVSPLLILEALLVLSDHDSLLTSLKKGNWQNIVASATAALICGFFWEMWNVYSLSKWEYSLPFVNQFHIFAMPFLGYVGYLPFGVECTRISDIFINTLYSNCKTK